MPENYTVRSPPAARTALSSHPPSSSELIAIAISSNKASAERALRRLVEEEEEKLIRLRREPAPTPEPSSQIIDKGKDSAVTLAAIANVNKLLHEARERRCEDERLDEEDRLQEELDRQLQGGH